VSSTNSPKTLYVSRRLLHTTKFINWAGQWGFKSVIAPEHLHVTIIFSKTKLPWDCLTPRKSTVINRSTDRKVEALGDKGAVVLRFQSPNFKSRFQELVAAGARSDFPSFKAHITITYDGGHLDPADIDPFEGPLHFGHEVFREVDEDWADNVKEQKL
jgi:hypothetical protein